MGTIEILENGARVYFKGEVNGEEILRTNQELMDLPLVQQGHFSIWDYREVDSVQYTKKQFNTLISADKWSSKSLPRRKIAIVTSRDLTFGLARMYQMSLGDGTWDIRVFSSNDEAEIWVGLQQR